MSRSRRRAAPPRMHRRNSLPAKGLRNGLLGPVDFRRIQEMTTMDGNQLLLSVVTRTALWPSKSDLFCTNRRHPAAAIQWPSCWGCTRIPHPAVEGSGGLPMPMLRAPGDTCLSLCCDVGQAGTGTQPVNRVSLTPHRATDRFTVLANSVRWWSCCERPLGGCPGRLCGAPGFGGVERATASFITRVDLAGAPRSYTSLGP